MVLMAVMTSAEVAPEQQQQRDKRAPILLGLLGGLLGANRKLIKKKNTRYNIL